MLKSVQNQTFLEIKETSPGRWLAGLAIIVFGTILGLLGFTGLNNAELDLLVFAISLLIVSTGFLLVYATPATKIIVDRATGQVAVSHRKIIGRRKRIFNFEEIKYFRLVENRNNKNSSTIGLELRNGIVVSIIMLRNHVEEFESQYILKINEFIRQGAFTSPKPISIRKQSSILAVFQD